MTLEGPASELWVEEKVALLLRCSESLSSPLIELVGAMTGLDWVEGLEL